MPAITAETAAAVGASGVLHMLRHGALPWHGQPCRTALSSVGCQEAAGPVANTVAVVHAAHCVVVAMSRVMPGMMLSLV